MNTKTKIISLLLTFVMILGLMPTTAFSAETDGKVHVIVENTTFTPESDDWDDKYWYGTLVDTWVDIDGSSTMMSCIVTALEEDGHTQVGAENNYISKIDGLGEFDGGFMSGWMGTLNDWFTNYGFAAFTVEDGTLEAGDEIRVMYTCAYGDDLGGSWSNSDTTLKALTFSAGTLSPAFDKNVHTYTLTVPSGVSGVVVTPTASNKNYQVRTTVGGTTYKRTATVPVTDGTQIVVECNYAGSASMNDSGDTQTYTVTVSQTAAASRDVSGILNDTMAQLAATVTEPNFGTTAGEWTVLCLARGGYYELSDAYFSDYYDRIVEKVNTTAASVNLNGGLHKAKSTENARLIMALSAIGKTSEKIGDWNLVEAYSLNGFNWIKKQGINGPIFALIALDTHDYATSDPTIRRQCIDFILGKQFADGGWALSGTTADPDITAMALQALSNYRSDETVAAAIEKGIDCMSAMQQDNGGYASWGSINSESIAQIIVACTALGINPDTDPHFVKNGNSAVDALLGFYNSEKKMFMHVMNDGGNAMATDQATYALIAYNRFIKGQNSLYNMNDVEFAEPDELSAILGLPQEIGNKEGTVFNAVVNIKGWDNDAGYKLMDAVVTVPDGLAVTGVTMGSRVSGGQVNFNLDESTGKLRIVYFDPEAGNSLVIDGTEFPAEFFTVGFKTTKSIEAEKLDIAITGMSVKFSSDSASDIAMQIVNTDKAYGSVNLKKAISFSACVLYKGDGVDLIPESKMAVCVAVANLEGDAKLTFTEGAKTYEFMYSEEITAKTGVKSYVALVDATIALEKFADSVNFTLNEDVKPSAISFGDTNADGVINAQDALNAVNFWLRKTDAPDDGEILRTNINADSRINTFDALGIVEYFVKGNEFIIVNKAATVASH